MLNDFYMLNLHLVWWYYHNSVQKTYKIKYQVDLMTSSCQDHNNTVCVTGSYLQLTQTAMSVQQHKAQCINFLVLFFKDIFNTHIFRGCNLCNVIWDIISYNEMLAALAVNPTSGVRGVCSSYQCIRTWSLMYKCIVSGTKPTVQFTPQKLPSSSIIMQYHEAQKNTTKCWANLILQQKFCFSLFFSELLHIKHHLPTTRISFGSHYVINFQRAVCS